ncbi:MAG TPA: malate dehydrogenase (quinone) [Kofleriaceae bacterium]|nr:malate dehydrogenase (quinone) [Kofleriaceae bacterium]
MQSFDNATFDVILVGAGIMSATLATLLKELQPSLRICVVERLRGYGLESSDAWNNAGTGHSAFCELNYTPTGADGTIDVKKALKIANNFEISKELWAFLVERGSLSSAADFIRRVPHMSFVWDNNCEYLRDRFAAMLQHPQFSDMVFSNDPATLMQWMPLVMRGRDPQQAVAATRMECGTDVNFGALTRALFHRLERLRGMHFHMEHDITDLERVTDAHGHTAWHLIARDLRDQNTDGEPDGHEVNLTAPFVFIGAGGGALPLLDKAKVVEADGYGGFPISGQWLVCNNPRVIAEHHGKVYGKASVGAPPMSVPHLDTRIIDGEKRLLFGPFAGFSTKFLKNGSYFDLPASVEWDNMFPMLSAGWNNLELTRYLVAQVTLSHEDRIEALREYLPEARAEDWELAIAGQRVQVIKRGRDVGGVLEFGTEVISTKDGSLAALLGASPGASTSVAIMLEVLQRCFPEEMASSEWQTRLAAMMPSYVQPVGADVARCKAARARTSQILGLA